MNFKTEITFEGRVLNGKIVNNKVVLDELFGVSLVDEVNLSTSKVKELISDLNKLYDNLMEDKIGKDNLIWDDKSIQGCIKTCNLSSKPITVDVNSFSWTEFIEGINKGVEELDKNNSTKLI